MADKALEQHARDTALKRLKFLFEIAQELTFNAETAKQHQNVAAELDAAGRLFCEEARFDLDQANDPSDLLYEKHNAGKVLQGAAMALRATGDQWEDPESGNPVFLLIEAALCDLINWAKGPKLES